MMNMAYSEMGLSLDRFFELSWYEWGLECLKLKRRNEKRLETWEGNTSVIREFMALMANINRDDKKKSSPFKGSDFIKLSFDKEEAQEEVKLIPPEEVDKMFGGKFLKT